MINSHQTHNLRGGNELKFANLEFESDDFASGMEDALEAMIQLPKCRDIQCAKKHYENLDNSIIVQGTLYPASVKLFPYICEMALSCERVALSYIFDLIVELLGGLYFNIDGEVEFPRQRELIDYVNDEWLLSIRNLYDLSTAGIPRSIYGLGPSEEELFLDIQKYTQYVKNILESK
jgi:hypothetical protein